MGVDGLYFRVSSEHQTTENQFEELLLIAEKDDSTRDRCRIRQLLSRCVFVEQGRSSKTGASRRPMFEQMKRDAALRKFDRLLVWKVSRLGRDMREVVSTVYELADLGVTVLPVKSQTGPINSTMGKLLWAIQAWFAEMENDERSDAIKAGLVRARANGKQIGRPRAVFHRNQVPILREQGLSWGQIASRLGVSIGTVRRAYSEFGNGTESSQ